MDGPAWQGLALGLILTVGGVILGIVIRIATDVHDSAVFRRTHAKDIQLVAQQVRDLHKWHDVRDDDGVFAWYIRKSLEERITDLAHAIEELAQAVKSTGKGGT